MNGRGTGLSRSGSDILKNLAYLQCCVSTRPFEVSTFVNGSKRPPGFSHFYAEFPFHTRCFLPLSAALAFRDAPGLVAAAVRTFCSDDPDDRKHAVRMARLLGPLTSAPGKNGAGIADGHSQPLSPRFVEVRIAFTRHLYAQLHHAAVVPAKPFPPG